MSVFREQAARTLWSLTHPRVKAAATVSAVRLPVRRGIDPRTVGDLITPDEPAVR